MLENIDRLLAEGKAPWKSRSEVIRQALQEFIARREHTAREEREIFRRHRIRLNRQAAALVKEQSRS